MASWKRLFGPPPAMSLDGTMFRARATLFSGDGRRSAEVREFTNGEIYLLESERVDDGESVARHEGRLVGPFPSPEDAERFVVATSWFKGDEYVVDVGCGL